jgi:dephospho-CoA kinase
MPEDLEYAHPWIRGEVRRDPRYLDLLEGCFHPLVREVCEVFMASHCRAEAVIWDIPLLYEAGWEADCDAVIVVVAPLEERLRRLGAERWTEEDKRWWHHIQGRQWPPERTIPLANYVLENAVSVEASTEALNRWITEYTKRRHDA